MPFILDFLKKIKLGRVVDEVIYADKESQNFDSVECQISRDVTSAVGMSYVI